MRDIQVPSKIWSLDEALSLLVDPHQLFVQVPDIQLMLTQSTFEKIWIMDAEVFGAELTTTYYELLTVEARLARETRPSETDDDQTALTPRPRRYHRRVGSLGEDGAEDDSVQTGWSAAERRALAERLRIERPRGALPLELKNPAPSTEAGFRRTSSGRGGGI